MSRNVKPSDTAWCPGCGNFSILSALDKAIEAEGMDRKKLVLVSGIGQAAKLPHYTDGNVFNGLHGRTLPAATGIKIANRELNVIVTSGDGDLFGEGGNHFLHAMRRNIGIKVFAHDNQVYGLTKGQASPTAEPGFVTKIQRHGVILKPANPIALAIVEDVSFVARATAANVDHLVDIMRAAMNTEGFALVDILQTCVSFNKEKSSKWYKNKCVELPEDYDPYDRDLAMKTALADGKKISIGVIYRSNRKSFEDLTPSLQGPPLSDFSATK